MELTEFGFYTESVSENTVQVPAGNVNFMMKCYNLQLLMFYFFIMAYVLHVVQVCVRRMKKFTRS